MFTNRKSDEQNKTLSKFLIKDCPELLQQEVKITKTTSKSGQDKDHPELLQCKVRKITKTHKQNWTRQTGWTNEKVDEILDKWIKKSYELTTWFKMYSTCKYLH